MIPKILLATVGALLGLALLLSQDRALIAGITFLAVLLLSGALYATKKTGKGGAATAILAYLTVFIILIFYVFPSHAISTQSGTILTDNWWQGLNWIRDNTAECATVATYWDPGHFITAIARRPVVFDGATQNSLRTIPYDGPKRGLEITPLDGNIRQIISYEDGSEVHKRIKDIGISLLTSDEATALGVLKNYRKPGCDEFYYLASSDLIFKSVWWSYFATWDPTRTDEKGDRYSYAILQQARRKPIVSLNTIGYEYPLDAGQSFILCQTDGTISPCTDSVVALFQAGPNFARVQRLMYMSNNRLISVTDSEAELPGTILVLDPRGQTVVYMPPEVQDSMFTKMFFLNGAGLENFEMVGNWGGEVKLFRVTLED